MTKGYENLFPKNKDKLKIIVAEHQNRIVFALHLWIEKDLWNNNVGCIHDLLINRNCYGQLSDPQEILKRMVFSLESIAGFNRCSEIRLPSSAIIEDHIMQSLKYSKMKKGDQGGIYWSKARLDMT